MIQTLCQEPDLAHAGQQPATGPAGPAVAALHDPQATVHRHGLRRIFDATGGAQAAMRAQRIVGRAVAVRRAAYPVAVPFQHAVEQAHAALMWNARRDPRAI